MRLARKPPPGDVGDLRHEHADDAGQQRQHDDRRVAREHPERAQIDGEVDAFARRFHGAAQARAPASADPHVQVRSLGIASMILKIALFHAFVVAGEDFHHFGVRHRLDAALAFETDVVVGDQRDVDVAHLEFAGEIGLRIVGHVDDLPAQAREPLRFRARRETRALDDDDRAGRRASRSSGSRSALTAIGRICGQYGSAKLTCVVIGPS